MEKLKGFVKLTRPYILLTTITIYVGSAFLSVNGIPLLSNFIIGLLATSFAIAASHIMNDYSDREIDLHNPRTANRPIPIGLISPLQALIGASLFGVGALLLTFFLNFYCVLVAFAAAPLPFLYNFMRKHRIPLSFICTVLAVVFITLFGSVAVNGQLLLPSIFLLLLFVVTWESGRILISEIQDVDHDASADIMTLSVAISSHHAAKLILVLFTISAITSLAIGLLGQIGFFYLLIAFATNIWLIYRSIGLVRNPTMANAISMRVRAPRYLVTICLVLAISIALKASLPVLS